MDGSGANAASPAHSMPGSHSRPLMGAAQGLDKMPRQPQNLQMRMSASMLDIFVHQQQDDPYFAGLRSQRQGQVHLGNFPVLPPTFHQYRTTFTPSESSVVPPSNATDSGYGSGHRPSVGIPSTYGDADHFTDTQSVTGRMEELCTSNLSSFPVDHGSQRNVAIAGWSQAGERLMPNNGNNEVLDTANVCPTCKVGCRTRSDLKKHIARHTRPHLCEVANCARTQGFSTANDLARHMRSRHPETNAQGHFYKCNLGPCANGSKRWPRADNFRQHLLRKHKRDCNNESIDEFICSVEEPAAESIDNDPAGLHIPNVGSDPAAIQSLASRALRGIVPLENRQADTRMADPNPDFSHHDSSMVGIQFSDVPPPADSASHVELRHPDDGQVMHSRHEDLYEDLHIGPALPEATFSFTRSDALESWSGGEPVRSSTPEPHMAIGNPPNTIYQDRQPRGHLQPYPPATTDLSSSGSLSTGSDVDQEHEPFMHMDEDHPSECQPTDPHDDPDLPDEDNSSVANPETEPRSIPAISLVGVPQESGPSPTAASAPMLSRPAPGEGHSIDTMNPLELETFLKRLEETTGPTALGTVLEKLGYEKSRPPSSKTKKPPSGNGGSSGPGVACKAPNCDASFQRECELRKHMKRHDRPYGCTFSKCKRRFGSKSDWKRHENSQHSPVDVWKCDEYAKSLPDHSHNEQRCGKVSYRRETFKAHLLKEHGFDVSAGNADQVNAKLASCRRGEQDCESAFWCGFCVRRIDVAEKDGRGTERFNHIDAHLCGRGTDKRRFDEWKYDDQDAPSHLGAGPASAAQPASDGSGRFSSGSPSSDSSRDKRRSGTSHEEHSRRAKRPKVGGRSRPLVWFCCYCDNFNSVALLETCGGGGTNPDCTHSRCPNCHVMESSMEMDLPEVT